MYTAYSLSLSHRLPGHFTEERDVGLNLEGAAGRAVERASAEDRVPGNVRVAHGALAWPSWTGPGGVGGLRTPAVCLSQTV